MVFFLFFPWFVHGQADAVRSTIKGHLAEIKKCYTVAIAREPRIAGKIVVDWTIDDSGKAREASINEKKTTLTSLAVQNCIVALFRTWKFPEAPKGASIKASYPFEFSTRVSKGGS